MHSEEEYYHKADNLIRISRQALCEVFQQRWIHCKETEWTSDSAQQFVQHEGKEIYSQSTEIQRQNLEKGNLDALDLNIFIDILIRVKCLLPQNEKSETALKNLRSARNSLAHNAQKKMIVMAYQKFEDVVRQALSSLDINSENVDHLISQAGLTSSVTAWKHAKKIQDLADLEVVNGNHLQAIKHYDDALLVPSLLPVNLCALYEQRASCYLEIATKESTQTIKSNILKQAMTDINEAFNNNKNSWKAYMILARIHKANNDLEKAIVNFTKALAIRPAETNLHQELDECKYLLGYMDNESHFDNGKSLEELAAEISVGSPIKFSPEMYVEFNKQIGDEDYPGYQHVFTGHTFEHGWDGVKQNYEEAVRHYAIAAQAGNTMGMYHLARMTQEGKGVKRNLPYALDLLQNAAKMPAKILSAAGKKWIVDRGVQQAQHSLGSRYLLGVGVPQDYKTAVEWFQKAVDTGSPWSAHNLGIMYWKGLGVEQNSRMAERLFKNAVEHGNVKTTFSLYQFYCWELEPEKAKYWLERSIELGQDRTPFGKDDGMESIKIVAEARQAFRPMVEKMENKFGLNLEHTFRKRLENANLAQTANHEEKVNEIPKNVSNNVTKESCAYKPLARVISKKDFDIICKKAKDGSKTAQQLMTAFGYGEYLHLLWNSNGGPQFTKERSKNIITFLYLEHCANHYLIPHKSKSFEKELFVFLESMFVTYCNESGDLDKKIRILYAMSTTIVGKPFGIEILKEGVRRYPNEQIYYVSLSRVYYLNKENEAGLKVTNEGLKHFPEDVNLLYYKAVHTRFLLQATDDVGWLVGNRFLEQKVRNACEDFLAVAAKDHYFVPDVYYRIALTYLYQNNGCTLQQKLTGPSVSKQVEKILEYYELGLMAEKLQMPCYLTYKMPSKMKIINIVKTIKCLKSVENNENLGVEVRPTQIQIQNFAKNLSKHFPDNDRDYLKCPKRIEVIQNHRELLQVIAKEIKDNKYVIYKPWEVAKLQENSNLREVLFNRTEIEKPLLAQKLPKNLAGLEEITIRDMDPTLEKIYENKILDLTLVEDPIMGVFVSIHLVAMDDNKEMTRVSIYNVPHNKEIGEKLAFGCKLSILNPYRTVFKDRGAWFRVDEPNCIIFGEKLESMCRYCGRENASKTCSRCKWAKYCSRECQIPDWKELGHNLICKLRPTQ